MKNNKKDTPAVDTPAVDTPAVDTPAVVLNLAASMLDAFIDGILGDETQAQAYSMIDLSAGYAPLFEKEKSRVMRATFAGFNPLFRYTLIVRRVIFDLDFNWRLAEQRIELNTGNTGKFNKLAEGMTTTAGTCKPSVYGFYTGIDDKTRKSVTDEYARIANMGLMRVNAILPVVQAKQAAFNGGAAYTPASAFNMLKVKPFAGIMEQFRKDFPIVK